MRESFLHFIWQFQKFDNIRLSTVDNQPVQIYAIGQYNTDSGPDFLNAKIALEDINWYGHVEIHLKSSDWDKHKHQHDEAYNNVILHVVWEHDQEVQTENGQVLPVIELKNRIKPDLLKRCNQLIKSPQTIPCEGQIDKVRDIDKWAMLSQAGVLRLENKSAAVMDLLNHADGSWEEATYRLLAKNFGFKTNSEAFLKLAERLPFKILSKHVKDKHQLEALVFGMAGFLRNDDDEYAQHLKKEYSYLEKKYKLQETGLIRPEWKYLRMRPGNFPTVRLAQFVAFIGQNTKCFDPLVHYSTVKDLRALFKTNTPEYWSAHYDFGKESSRPMDGMGSSSVDLILINTVAPLLAAYAKYSGDESYMDKAVELLQSLKPENNKIIKQWSELSIIPKDAFDSQSIINLHNEFCLKKKCLSCKIGVNLINS